MLEYQIQSAKYTIEAKSLRSLFIFFLGKNI